MRATTIKRLNVEAQQATSLANVKQINYLHKISEKINYNRKVKKINQRMPVWEGKKKRTINLGQN